jgi:anti-anti-sigma factor
MTSMRHLSIDVADTPTGICVRLTGVLDFSVRDQLVDTLQCLLARTPPAVEVDVAGLRLLDAAGIGVLIRMQRCAGQHGCDLYLSHPHGMVARVLAITETTPILTRDPTRTSRSDRPQP